MRQEPPQCLAVLENEAVARLAEQRLREAGIPCYTRSLMGGPGVWGSAFQLPHALYVYPRDSLNARELLGLPPLELEEREPLPLAAGGRVSWWLALVALIVLVVLSAVAGPVFSRLYGWPS
ncbi:MAG: hypothetical protein FJ316_04725 [SAR202 cluster bacterium]|nr:hypothetical protein [SAR202 cluster bacterium]